MARNKNLGMILKRPKIEILSLVLLLGPLWCLRARAADPAYPLKISANRRYLVDQNNAPFLYQGDTPWSLIVGLTKEEAEEYLENRRRKGFNSLIVNLIEHKFCAHPPQNRAGDEPFTKLGDFSTPNENYFAHADWVIEKAGEMGMQVVLAPIYLGYKGTDEGWYEEAVANGPAKCREYGRYVGKRYGRFPNLLWLMGGDRDPEYALDCLNQMALAIKEADGRHLFTAHVAPEHSPLDVIPGATWLDLNTTYTYKLVHDSLLRDYNRTPVRPFFLIESTYEGEHNSTPVQIRRQAYWAILCGAAGQSLGNRPIWLFDPGWRAAMDAEGSVSMAHLKALFDSRPWYELVPDQKHQVVTEGLGEFNGLDYLAAARAADGGTVIAYMPSRRKVTVEMSKISGSLAKVWWFDPRTGKAESVGTFAARGAREFTPPAEGDWVLVLDDAARNLPAPGTRPGGD
jgi:hypothetical protein